MPGRFGLTAVVILLLAGAGSAGVPTPADLPRYQIEATVDTNRHVVEFRQTVTWTNRYQQPTDELVFSFYPLFRIPDGDSLLLGKTLELLRLNPAAGIDPVGEHGTITAVRHDGRDLTPKRRPENQTALVIPLPRTVRPGESITVELTGVVQLPNKQGRWGYWSGITYLANLFPVVAFFDDRGWHDVPFVPWHQPFWNEAGVYTSRITIPADQVIGCSAEVESEAADRDGWKRVTTKPFVGRDFAVVCSADFKEYRSSVRMPDGRDVALKCVAFERHAFFAEEMLKIVARALPEYARWFGPFPYDQFTIAESFFGWNGNECAGLIMIDERVFDMPKMSRGYVEYLVSHEACHQWWYNQVGTNGFAETWVDEGAATYFTHRMLDLRKGKNNQFFFWPEGSEWLPNVYRDNYRFGSLYGAIRRGDAPAAAGPLPEFGNLVNLFTGAYDRGSKVFGMIEARLGEAAFLDFVQGLVKKYSFRVLAGDDIKAELIAYTGPQSADEWNAFFDQWVYGKGLTDWKLESVTVNGRGPRRLLPGFVARKNGGFRVEVVAAQIREIEEPTVVAFQFDEGDGFPVRVPIGPTQNPIRIGEFDADVEPLGGGRYRVSVTLPREPAQVVIDPDRVVLDADPANNGWVRRPNVQLVPFYSFAYDNDLTNDYDRWNVRFGPWAYGAFYSDPWYTRSSLLGLRAGVYRTQTFYGGAYVAFRPEFRDLVVGADGLFDHVPFPKTQVGFNVEQRIAGPWNGDGDRAATRATLFGRYVLNYASSLYLPPMQYVEAFTSYQDNFLPFARNVSAGSVRPEWTWLTGLHYRLNLYTPYWDPERGVWVDLVAAAGPTELNGRTTTAQFRGEFAAARKLPDGLGYFSDVKVAGRAVVQGAVPDRGQFFALGGGTLFRGFDLAERQGSFLWVANAEARFPVVRHAEWNLAGGIVGVRGVQLATFYDVGTIYDNGHSVGGAAHALGGGVRVDLAVFSFIERATLRFDVGKTLNAATPFQFWFGIQQPF